MAHLDLTYITENVTSDKDFIAKVLKVFCESLESDIPPLRAAVEQGDFDAVKRNSHKVKSGFRSLGMVEITGFLQELEDMGRDHQSLDLIEAKFNGFLALLPEVQLEIRQYLKENPA